MESRNQYLIQITGFILPTFASMHSLLFMVLYFTLVIIVFEQCLFVIIKARQSPTGNGKLVRFGIVIGNRYVTLRIDLYAFCKARFSSSRTNSFDVNYFFRVLFCTSSTATTTIPTSPLPLIEWRTLLNPILYSFSTIATFMWLRVRCLFLGGLAFWWRWWWGW